MRTVLAALMLALAGGCTAAEPAPVERLTIAAGHDNSAYHRLGEALAEQARQRWSVRAEVVQTDDSVDSVRRLDTGEAQIAFTTLDVAMMALHGNSPFNAAVRTNALAGIYVDYLHLVVRADSSITELAGLTGRRVAMGPQGSGLDIVASRVIALVPGVQKQALPPPDAANALRTGAIDAFFVLGGLSTPVLTELVEQLEIRVLPLDSQYPRLRSEFGDTYLLRSIPKGVYRMDAPVTTLGVPNALVVRADLPEPAAYRLTELLFAAKARLAEAYREARHLDHRSALTTIPLPLHPGAERYYHDTKPMALPPAR